jgi:hypothetical protein
MAYLPGFDADVFISYAHNDNEPFGPEKCGWVALLHEQLAKRIQTYLNQPPEMWRDPDIAPSDLIDEKIANRLKGSAILLTVLSENFLERPYCQLEVKVFCESAGAGLKVGETCRIFQVELRPVTRNKLPPIFEGTGTFHFYNPETKSELRPLINQEEWPRYYKQLDFLALKITDTLRRMQRGAPCGAEIASGAGTVYLAETTEDQDETREQVLRDLQTRGIGVLPQGSLPNRGDKFEQQVRECLSRSDLSIHVFGMSAGFKPDERDRGSTWLQHDLALERGKDADFRRILWWPSNLSGAKEDQRKYLKDLESDPSAEIFQGNLEELKDTAQKTLEEIRRKREERNRPKAAEEAAKEPAAAASASAEKRRRIYLMCDAKDLPNPTFKALDNFLFQRGYEVRKTMPAGAKDARKMHEYCLQNFDAFVIYYGEGSEVWVQRKLDDLEKFRNTSQAPVRSKAVYIGPPDDEAKREFRVHEWTVIPPAAEFSAEQMSAFLAPLQKP